MGWLEMTLPKEKKNHQTVFPMYLSQPLPPATDSSGRKLGFFC